MRNRGSVLRAESARFALEAAKSLAEPLPEPPQQLSEGARRYWASIIGSKRRLAWSDNDLLLACQLARDYDAVETMTATLDEEGPVLTRASGLQYPHPVCNLLDKANRRIILSSRALQVHSIATTGRTEDQGNKNEASRTMASKINDASDLIKRIK